MKNGFRALAILAPVLGLAGCETFLGLGGETVESEAGPDAGRGADAGDAKSPEAGRDGGTEADSPMAADTADGPTDGGDEDGPAVLPPSCAPGGPGMTDCASGDSGYESCCTSLEVEGGTFYRTYTNFGSGASATADPATVSSFRLDKYDVTVGRFRQFVAAWTGDGGSGGGWNPAPGSGIHTHLSEGRGLVNAGATSADGGAVYETGWVGGNDGNIQPYGTNLADIDPSDAQYVAWTNGAGNNEHLPMNRANWYEAYAFCIWDGGFLPTEAEWEYAAAGGSEEREYPWGSTDPGTGCPGPGCNYAIYNCDYPNSLGMCSSLTNIAPVGTAWMGAGLWGQLDLVGNMYQWTLDWYPACASAADMNYLGGSCLDCADLTPPSCTTDGYPAVWIRGGSFQGVQAKMTPFSTIGSYVDPHFRNYGIGFRCARIP